MTKKLRKPLSIILSLMMILSVFTALPLTAHAAQGCPDCGSEGVSVENYTVTSKNGDGSTIDTTNDSCAAGHTYGDPTWTVDAQGNVTAKFDCTNCNYSTSVTITAKQFQMLLAMGTQVTKTWKWADDYSAASLVVTGIPAQVLMAV